MQSSLKDGKRNRRPTSCEQCRTRKLKCNRGLPCSTCIARGKESVCEYASNANRNKPPASSSSAGNRRHLADRLRRLEGLISQFVQSAGDNEATASSSHLAVSDALRVTSGGGSEPGQTPASLNNQPSPSSNWPAVVADLERQGGLLRVEEDHWLSILDDIKEIREQLTLSDTPGSSADQDDEPISPGAKLSEGADVDLVLGPMQVPGIAEIIQSLPPKHVCDGLVSQYFTSRFMILPIIHPYTFQKEYDEFWQNPTAAPVLWMALLFAVLSVAATLRQRMKKGLPMLTTPASSAAPATPGSKTDADSAVSPKALRIRTAHCLVLGRYFHATAYALEALLLHAQSNYLGLTDSSVDLWFLLGTVIRLAIGMGYHRDPDTRSGGGATLRRPPMSPFEGEMRRRVWHTILQMDSLASYQAGAPSMIPTESGSCNTRLPRNLKNTDFGPESEVLPPSRPLTDDTPVLYTIVKSGVMSMFTKIVTHTRSLPSSLGSSSPEATASTGLDDASYATTLQLDAAARATYGALPEYFKMKPLGQSLMESINTIMNRVTIGLLYLKSLVILHRPYLNYYSNLAAQGGMTSSGSGSGGSYYAYDFSRGACIEAALDILARQAELHEVSARPGGLLYEDRWMLASLMAHDFLLAAMVVCLELSVRMRVSLSTSSAGAGKTSGLLSYSGSSSSGNHGRGHYGQDSATLLEALRVSKQVWDAKTPYSAEARMAARALEAMITKAQRYTGESINELGQAEDGSNRGPAQAEASETTGGSQLFQGQAPQPYYGDPVADVLDGSGDLDWALLDQYLQMDYRQGDGVGSSGGDWGGSFDGLDMNWSSME